MYRNFNSTLEGRGYSLKLAIMAAFSKASVTL